MENRNPSEKRILQAREVALFELESLRNNDQKLLSAKTLVRMAILMQFESDPNGSVVDIERVLHKAIDVDKGCIEAYIELGRLKFAIHDDPQAAKVEFLKALELLKVLNIEVLNGLTECDLELRPQSIVSDLIKEYAQALIPNDKLGQ